MIERHRTAMHRNSLSRPMTLALNDGVIRTDSSILDYGCGRGGDVRVLRSEGRVANGWDPAFAPKAPRGPADVVNLGFVVNVIERPAERHEALLCAWKLTRRVLVVAARLEWEARDLRGRPHGDGIITTKGTFQKLFTQEELRSWIDGALGVRAVAAAPGVFYVFRDDAEAQRFLAARFRRRSATPRPRASEVQYDTHRELFEVIADFYASRGRLPRDAELPEASTINSVLGSIPKAFGILRRVTDTEQWETIATERSRDLLVYLALANFAGRPSFGDMPIELQLDVKGLFGSYKAATAQADKLLFAAGRPEAIDTAARAASFGKLTPEALYVHVEELNSLPPLLRIYEGCGRALTGTVEGANILKLHRQKAQVSYLAYPRFDRDAHPELQTVIVARLGRLEVTFRDFRHSSNPPILHRKETFVSERYPGHDRFRRLTTREEAAGLFDSPTTIGTKDGWQAALQASGVEIRGHTLRRTRSVSRSGVGAGG